MKKALISPNQDNFVVEVVDIEFEISAPLYWVDCPDNIIAYQYQYINSQYVEYLPSVPTAEENKQTAASLLQATDWTTIADVGNSQISNPYLANQGEFISYRNAVRQYAVYPVEGNIDWPAVPTEQWSN